MSGIKRACVFCGSSGRGPKSHHDAARALGAQLARAGIGVVTGGGRVGLMGMVADGALGAGGEVIGVIPGFLRERELGHAGLTELIVTDGMHERKARMFALSDAFLVLPGGLGTLDELFEILTWRQLRQHDKPIVVVNVAGYWDALGALLDRMISESYVHESNRRLLTVVATPEAAIEVLRAVPPPEVAADTRHL